MSRGVEGEEVVGKNEVFEGLTRILSIYTFNPSTGRYTMGGIKTAHSYELNDDVIAWLKEMADKYDLEDENKALRVALDYVKEEADLDEVFDVIRCNHCF